MKPVLTDSIPLPEPARENNRIAMISSFSAAILFNLIIAAILFLVTVGEGRRTPPTLVAVATPDPPDTPTDPPHSDPSRSSPRQGGSTLAPTLITVAATTSPLTITLPDLPSYDDGIVGLAGIGSGFRDGFGSGSDGGGGSMGSMRVGKINVKSMRLGVILDVSGSMESHLPGVKREVRKAFRDAKTVDVEGCSLVGTKTDEEEEQKVRLKSTAKTVLDAAEMLVLDGKVDALYWFSDLQDTQTETGLARLREILRIDQGRAKAVRFYIRSLQVEPSPELTAIVKASGGAIQAGEKGE